MATTVTRYVNTASTAGGDGTTNNTSGATRAYATLDEAITNEAKDLVSADETLEILCSGGEDLQSSLDMLSGFTTDSTRRVEVKGNPGTSDGANDADEEFSTSHYYINRTSNGGSPVQLNTNGYLTMTALQVNRNINGNSNRAIHVDAHVELLMNECRLRFTGSVSTGNGVLVSESSGNTVLLKMKNCILDGYAPGSTGGGSNRGVYINDGDCLIAGSGAWNCTIVNYGSAGVEDKDGGFECVNLCVAETGDDFDDTNPPSTITNCASDDGDGTNPQTLSATRTDDFVGFTVENFFPAEGGALQGNGTPQSADADVPSLDILGTTRDSSTPTIGAFEIAPPEPIPALMLGVRYS